MAPLRGSAERSEAPRGELNSPLEVSRLQRGLWNEIYETGHQDPIKEKADRVFFQRRWMSPKTALLFLISLTCPKYEVKKGFFFDAGLTSPMVKNIISC